MSTLPTVSIVSCTIQYESTSVVAVYSSVYDAERYVAIAPTTSEYGDTLIYTINTMVVR